MLYDADYPKGTLVRIASRSELDQFRQTWQYHHKLQDDQFAYADREARVKQASYYHGGDVLYLLEGVPGYWHECCLRKADSN
jgi:hypothetical protein